jgi:hypothetical protein
MRNDGIVDKGDGRKRMTIYNELYRGSKFALIRKDADLPLVLYGMNKSKPMNVSYSTTPIGERLTDALKVNRLHAGITKAVNKRGLLPDTKGLYKHLSGMRGNFHVRLCKNTKFCKIGSLFFDLKA